MSVSIALLPVALAMRVVMGKKNFENWVNAQQVRVPSIFKSELELTRAIKQAGYDAVKFGSSIKTHIDGEKVFFFWEFVDGKWIAVFSKHHEQAVLNRFMSALENSTGIKIFGEKTNTSDQSPIEFPTNFRDGAMLIEALKELGAHPVMRANGPIICKIDRTELVFQQIGASPFTVEIKNSPSLEQAYHFLSDIDDDYKRCVQTAIYEKVKARATESNMAIESEEVLADKTILITLRI